MPGRMGSFFLRCKFAVHIADRCQFVYTTKRRAVSGGDQACTNTPGSDFGSLNFQCFDQIFIQIVGSGDDRIWKTGFIQHFSDFLGKISQIATVHTDAIIVQFHAGFFHFAEYADRIRNTGF